MEKFGSKLGEGGQREKFGQKLLPSWISELAVKESSPGEESILMRRKEEHTQEDKTITLGLRRREEEEKRKSGSSVGVGGQL